VKKLEVEEVRTNGYEILHKPSTSSRSETIPIIPADKAVGLFLAMVAMFVAAWKESGDTLHDSLTMMNHLGNCGWVSPQDSFFSLEWWIPISSYRVNHEKPAVNRCDLFVLTFSADCGNFLGSPVIDPQNDHRMSLRSESWDLVGAED
jgi:hypothetical protein